MQLSFNKTN